MRKASSKYFKACVMSIGAVVALFCAAADSREKTLFDFPGGSRGAFPYGALIADSSGNLYGTTDGGGGGACEAGCGVVFKLTPDKHETVVYAFGGGSDGAEPQAGLIADKAGNFYGTTTSGGDTNCQGGAGCGTVFKLTPKGTETVLYAFHGASDGSEPDGELVADRSGNLFGETVYGGNYNGADCDVSGCGTVFELQADGTKVALHAFQAGSDGANPERGLVIDGAGNLYGTTGGGGGSGCGGGGCGTVFGIAADGTETVLYAFQGGADGAAPVGLARDSAGSLYGVTAQGGNCTLQGWENNCGTIYRLAPDGTKTILHDFQGGNDGLLPWNGLIIDRKGDLYGTTFLGGETGCMSKKYHTGCGTVFKLAADGTESVLHFFGRQGRHPYGRLLEGAHGLLHGTTTVGGKYHDGVIFKLKK